MTRPAQARARSRPLCPRLTALVLYCGVFSGCAHAEPPPSGPALRVNAPVSAQLRAGQTEWYVIRLDHRACALGTLVVQGVPASLRVFAPGSDVALRRTTSERARPLRYAFCSEAPGDYRVAVVGRAGAAAYTLALDAILPRRPPVKPQSPPRLDSARLRALAESLQHDGGSTDAFWQAIDVSGTPLVEALDDHFDLVTFLWRGDAQTRVVSLNWPAWTFAFADRALTRLGQSDVWWKSLRLPRSTRMSYRIVVDPPQDPSRDQSWEDRVASATWRVDPRNPKRMPQSVQAEHNAQDQRSLLELADALPERFLQHPSKAPASSLRRHDLVSASLGNTHELTGYLPAGYAASTAAYPLLIVFDGESYMDPIPTPSLLDALIAAKQIPPLVALFVRNATSDSREQELPCNGVFAEFLANELLPFVRAHYRVTRDPAQVCLAGSSFGGLASSYAAFRHPELFGLVLSQSGSYWWSFPRGSSAFDGAEDPGWLTRRFRESPRLPIRFYLNAGTFEADPTGIGVLETTRAFDAVLRAQGYVVQFEEFAGGHDPLAWRATLPNGLIALFGGLHAPPPSASDVARGQEH
jgi:enterochelin esterase-like enzyme